MRGIVFCASLSTFLCWFGSSALAQFEEEYQPRGVYGKSDKELLLAIDDRYEIQMKRMGWDRLGLGGKIHDANEVVKKAFKEGKFIHDSSLNYLLEKTYRRIIAANELACSPGNLFLMKSPIINAGSFIEGSIIFTTGLLSLLDDESELAFIIAHELAHYEKNHAAIKLLSVKESNLEEETGRLLGKTLQGKVRVQRIKEIIDSNYESIRFGRQMEIEADSLAVSFIDRAGYNTKSAKSALEKLDLREDVWPIHGNDIFSPLNTPRYPFDPLWAAERSAAFQQEPKIILFFESDSIASHPDNTKRIEELGRDFGGLVDSDDRPRQAIKQEVRIVSQFESALAAFESKQFDYCLYHCLRLKKQYPNNKFLSTMIAQVLLGVYEARRQQLEDEYVPKWTTDYKADLRRCNDLLHNLKDGELLDLAFHFLSYSPNFDKENESHYYLLHKICLLSHRNEVAKKIAESYLEKFPDGEFVKSMRDR
ncbi:MAG TPA: M48 family metallopeptidase [Cyclobacteriaceae bacterium]|nr:M48 family metallopeptidase [Cyclobacteriaceae bacterium]